MSRFVVIFGLIIFDKKTTIVMIQTANSIDSSVIYKGMILGDTRKPSL
jgi:hypothetical protein